MGLSDKHQKKSSLRGTSSSDDDGMEFGMSNQTQLHRSTAPPARYYWRLFSLLHPAQGDQDPMLRFHQFGAADCGHLFLGCWRVDSSPWISCIFAAVVNASRIPCLHDHILWRPCHPPWMRTEFQGWILQHCHPRRFLHAVGELRRDAVGRMDPFAEASLVGILGGLDTPWQWFMEKAISNVGWNLGTRW